MSTAQAKFAVGQLIHHKRFDYRGVVYDVAPCFKGTEDWYGQMAVTKPPRDRPWYHVLVDNSDLKTYVAERNLEPDASGEPVRHPELDFHFVDLTRGTYVPRAKSN